MPLSLDQYADYLDTRDLPWPAPHVPQPKKAKPHLTALPDLRLVTWNVYGTLLAISSGDLVFEHPTKFVMELALDKTVQEFKMWGSMSRKPGQPSEYMGQMYAKALSELRMAPSPGEKHPEISSEKAWENILKKLLQKDYKFDAGFFGSLNELSKKIAYFFHASLQGTACQPGAAAAARHVRSCGLKQGIIGDGQCFTLTQVRRGLKQQDPAAAFDELFDADYIALSHEHKARKPSERLFKPVLARAAQAGIEPRQILHIGSRLTKDIGPAKKLGMRTALYAGDKEAIEGSSEQLRDPATRPDVLLTELSQLHDIVAPAD